MVKVILIWLSRQMDFKSILLCVSASTAVAVFLGGKKNGCILDSLEICILIKNTYSVFLNARKGRRENTAARGREVLLWASCGFVPSGCFVRSGEFFLSHEQRAEWGMLSCLCAATPIACDLVPNLAVFWVEGVWGKAPRGRSLLCWEEAETFRILSSWMFLHFFSLLPDLLHLSGMCVRPLLFAPWHRSVRSVKTFAFALQALQFSVLP